MWTVIKKIKKYVSKENDLVFLKIRAFEIWSGLTGVLSQWKKWWKIALQRGQNIFIADSADAEECEMLVGKSRL